MTNAQSWPRSALIHRPWPLSPRVSQRFAYEWTEQTSRKVCMTALSKPATRFPWCPLGRSRPFTAGEHRTQSCLQALQWDGTGNICGFKGKGTGGRIEDTDRRHTNTSLCPSTADGEGQICSVLPGKPVDETKRCSREHREASGSSLWLLYVELHSVELTPQSSRDVTSLDFFFFLLKWVQNLGNSLCWRQKLLDL